MMFYGEQDCHNCYEEKPEIIPLLLLRKSYISICCKQCYKYKYTVTKKYALIGTVNEKIFLSFAGLRGATSIVFATYPVLAGIKHADKMFNIVFIIVVFSFMLQGTTIPLVSKLLKIKEEEIKKEKKNKENQ